MRTISKIDVHHHIFPREYVDALNSQGVEKSLGIDLPKWTVETSFKKMRENGIKTAILSISSPGVYFKGYNFPEGFSEKLARLTNEIIADNMEKYPDKFGGFATIPMLNPKAAMDELIYALDDLKLNGVCLLTNYKGKYLGHSDFEDFFKELNKRNAVVYIHPNDPGSEFDFELGIPNALIEVTFDTTRAVTNLMYNGVLDRYPNIKYILSHGGGTIPYIAWRLAGIEYGQKGKKPPLARALYDFLVKGEPTKGLRHLKKMYYDTANVSGEYTIKTLQLFAGPENILFGSDLCISKLAPVITKNLKREGYFNEEEFEKMAFKNGLNLFPSLKQYYS